MERLADEDCVDRAVVERDRLGGAVERRRLGHDALEHGAHLGQRLDREHVRIAAHKLARQLAGAGGEVEDDGVPGEPDRVERGLRVARPPALVLLRRKAEAPRQLGHAG